MPSTQGHQHQAAAGKSTPIAGAYNAVFDDLDMGFVQDGFTIRTTPSGIPIQSDVGGQSVFDDIFTGVEISVSMVLQHWNAQAVEQMIWWFGNADPTTYQWGRIDGVGQSQWENAKYLTLIACDAVGFARMPTPDTVDPEQPANTTLSFSTGARPQNPYIDPLDITFFKAILRKDESVDVALNHRPRYLPITLDIYPISNASPFDPASPDEVSRPVPCGPLTYFYATRGDGPV